MNIHPSALKAESRMGVSASGPSGDVLSLPHPPTPPHADFRWRGLAFLHPMVNVQQKLSALYFPVSTDATVTTVTLAVSQAVCPALHNSRQLPEAGSTPISQMRRLRHREVQ